MKKCPRYIAKWKEKDAQYIQAIFDNIWGAQCWEKREFYLLILNISILLAHTYKDI